MTDLMIANVKDYGATGNGSTNDSTAIQKAFDDTSKSAVYFPKGRYLISSPITIRRKMKMFGDGAKGYIENMASHLGTVLDCRGVGSSFAFKMGMQEEYIDFVVDNMYFMGKNILDLSGSSANASCGEIKKCNFDSMSDGGTAVLIKNGDFWHIHDSKFNGNFNCGIRVEGNKSPEKNSTQINIDHCGFIQTTGYASAGAISFELCNSCSVRKCDFAWTGKAVLDIGGRNYNSSSVGKCTAIIVDDNHFESMKTGILLDGCNNQMSQGIIISKNNFSCCTGNTKCIVAQNGIFGMTTSMNYMDLITDMHNEATGAIGIELGGWCHNAFCFMDYIVGKGTTAIKHINGGLNNIVWQRIGSNVSREEISWGFPKTFAREIRYDDYKQGASNIFE